MPAARLAQIESMIASRDGKPGYVRNVAALKAELARLTQIQDEQTFAAPAAVEDPGVIGGLDAGLVSPIVNPQDSRGA